MITLPLAFVDRADLTLLQRALLPLIVRHSLIWGEKPKALNAPFLSEILRHSVREVVSALDDLTAKNILIMVHEKLTKVSCVCIHSLHWPLDLRIHS